MRYDDDTHEHRLQSLERRMDAIEAAVLTSSSTGPVAVPPRQTPEPSAPLRVPPPAPLPPPARPPIVPPAAPAPPRPALPAYPTPAPPAPPAPRARVSGPPAPSLDFESLLGGKLFAWIGGVAILVGVVFFVATGIQRGWIPTGVRVAAAFAGSTALLGVGLWLHERRGRTQASLVAIGTAVAALYASLVAGTSLYHLIPTPLALCVATVVGAVATACAVRLDSVQVAGLGIVGALLAPVLVDAGPGTDALVFMAIALSASTAVLVWRRWDWLALAAYVVSAPQLARWALDEPSAHLLAIPVVLLAFWAIYVVAALGYEIRVPSDRLRPSSAMLAVSNVLFTTGLGWVALEHAGHDDAATSWVLGMAAVQIATGALAALRMRDGREIPLLFVACGVGLSAVGLALALDGPWLVSGWAAEAALLAYVARRLDSDRALVGAVGFLSLAGGLALHAAIVPGYASSVDAAERIAALLVVAAAALVAGLLLRTRELVAGIGVEGLLELVAALYALLALPIALDGVWLVAGLAAGATALVAVAVARTHVPAILAAGLWGGVALALSLHLALPDHGYASSRDAGTRIAALLVVAAACAVGAFVLRGNPWVPAATAELELLGAVLVLLALPIALDGAALVAALSLGAGLLAAAAGRGHGAAALAAAGWGATAVLLGLHLAVPDAGYATALDASTRIPALLAPAAAALACAYLLRRNPWFAPLGEVLATLAATLVLLALPIALDGTPLVAAFALGGVALALLGVVTGRSSAWIAATAWSVCGLAHVLAVDAPPSRALLHGVAAGEALALALAAGSAVAVALLARRNVDLGESRPAIEAGAGLAALYALSGLVVSAVPAGAGSTDGKQLALSAFWSIVGAGLLMTGLARGIRGLRLGGLALLSVTIAKVFLYDLQSLGSLTRVGSFIALGVLLLAAAYAYQRQTAKEDAS